MDDIVLKEQKNIIANGDDKDSIAKKISEDFKTYDDARSSNKNKAKELIKELYFNQNKLYSDEEDNWKSDVKLCKMYMLYQTSKAYIWKNSYSNINSMFNVSGESQEADSNSNKQKAMLNDKLYRMNFIQTSDEVLDYSMPHGEFISFCTWKKKTEEYRRPITFFETMFQTDIQKLPKIIEAKQQGKNYYIDERDVYNDPYVYPVDPFEFVFDVSQEQDFDAAPKILRTWRTPSDIVNNKDFEMTNDVKREINTMIPNSPTQNDLSNQEIKDENFAKHTNGSTIEVLEFFGDFTSPTGKVYKNWYAVVVGGKYLVKFCKNPLVINPFTFYAPLKDPNTKRGISMLYSGYSLAKKQEELMNKTIDLQSLIECPPILCPKDFFKEKELKIAPGKIYEYDGNLFPDAPVTPMTFDSTIFQADISFLDDVMSVTTGIFPNMSGASEADRTTATEISVKTEGQLTRLQMILDGISQNYIIECVRKVAALCANFRFGDERIFLNKDNNPEDVLITDAVRQADYRYTYSDRSSISERFNFADTTVQSFGLFLKAGLQMKIDQTFIWWAQQKGIENPERFLQQGMQMPQELQDAFMQDPEVQQAIQAYMQQQSGQIEEPKEQPPVIPNPQMQQQG